MTARRAGADFHDELSVMADNAVLVEVANITRSRMRWLLGQHDDLQEMVAEHAAIVSAIAAGNVEQAVALARVPSRLQSPSGQRGGLPSRHHRPAV